jgi:DNA invertase Pin-like site-specific DNA recombinase
MVLVGYARDVIDGFPMEAQLAQLTAKGCEVIFQDREPYFVFGMGLELGRAIERARGGALMVTNLPVVADDLVDLTSTLTDMRRFGTHLISIGPPAIDTTGPAGWRILELLEVLVALEEGGRRRKPQPASAAGVQSQRARGRKPKADPNQVLELSQQGYKANDIAAMLQLGRATVYRYLQAPNPGDSPGSLQDGE